MATSTSATSKPFSQAQSQRAFAEACQWLPGGVNSPVRAFKSVEGTPLFIEKALGATLTDIDGNTYIDYVGSWGPAILGHSHPQVVQAVQKVAEHGLSFGAPTERETELAKLVVSMIPSIDQIRFVNSGTEAVMSAVRLARAYTGRTRILKFEGCYHGHVDALLVKAGSGAATLGVPDSAGVPNDVTGHTMIVPYNDLEAVRQVFKTYGSEMAGVLVEPVAGNMGCVPPVEGFLQGLREVCSEYGALLIFDEVMTGFRVALGGAQVRYGITPDISAFGKIIGGGMPVGAYGARTEIMAKVAPLGPMYQAGTLSGNPLAMAAGLETLKLLMQNENAYTQLEKQTQTLVDGLLLICQEAGIPAQGYRVGSMFSLFFNDKPIHTYADVLTSNKARFNQYFWGMLEQGVYLAPSAFEAGFVSLAHDDDVIEKTLAAARRVIPYLV